MLMKTLRLLLIATSLLSAGSASAADAGECNTSAYGPWQYEIYVDEPTGYAFVKTPCGWRFVRQIDHDKIALAMQLAKEAPPTGPNALAASHVGSVARPDHAN
jgi:hypothetical protein